MKRRWIALATLSLLLAALAIGGYVYKQDRTGSVYHPHARFVPEPTPTLPKAHGPQRFAWPIFGYDPEHTRFFPAPSALRPPFKQVWSHDAGALLEFPPVLYDNRLFQLSDDGVLQALNVYDGHPFWRRRLGALSASSPAVDRGTVYVTLLSRAHGVGAGRVVAVDSHRGRIRWSRDLSSPSESSPLLDHGTLYLGSQSGAVYALDARSGRVRWVYRAGGAVKASPTLRDGLLYFGDYSGHIQAISAHDGRRVWISASEGRIFGSGNFYSTPAAIYGRVFLGNTDGRVYAYDALTGALDWAYQTGAYVYASPALTNAPGLGPTLYIGSYDGNFYAIDARSGHVDWTYHAGGRISGSATILGRVVYFSDLATHTTIGLGISTGRPLFKWSNGAFDPVISDGHNVYLTGYTLLYALTPKG